jgi:hypothetical protein
MYLSAPELLALTAALTAALILAGVLAGGPGAQVPDDGRCARDADDPGRRRQRGRAVSVAIVVALLTFGAGYLLFAWQVSRRTGQSMAQVLRGQAVSLL